MSEVAPFSNPAPEAWRLTANKIIEHAVAQLPAPEGVPEPEVLVIGRQREFTEACITEEGLLPTSTRAWHTACQLLVRHGAYLRTAEAYNHRKRYVGWGALTTGFMALEPPERTGPELVVPALKISTYDYSDSNMPFSHAMLLRAQQPEPGQLSSALGARRRRNQAFERVLGDLHEMPTLKLEVGVVATKAALLSDKAPKAHWELVYPRTKKEARTANSHNDIPGLKYISGLMGAEPSAAFWLEPIKAFKEHWYDDEPTQSSLVLRQPYLPRMPYIDPALTPEQHAKVLQEDIASVKSKWEPVGVADNMLAAAKLTDTPLRSIAGFGRPLTDWRRG